MIPGRPIVERAQRIIDQLTERLDDQAMRKGADAPHLVAIVGAFHGYAGKLEHRLRVWPDPATIGPDSVRERMRYCAAELRMLRRIVTTHATLVRLHAAWKGKRA